MAFIVETGNGNSTANSYVDVLEADTYHSTVGNVDWASYTTEEKEQSLMMATRAVDQLYGLYYLSVIKNQTQTLLFPRHTFYDRYGRLVSAGVIPTALKDAVSEIALMHINGGDIFPFLNNDKGVQEYSVKLDAIEESIKYAQNQNKESYPGFRKIDLAIAALLTVPPTQVTSTGSSGNWSIVT